MELNDIWKYAAETARDIQWNLGALNNKTFLITGSTGLIGSQLMRVLLLVSSEQKLNLRFILPVRNVEKARHLFSRYEESLSFCQWQMGEPLEVNEPIDYIVHLACTTSSNDFLNRPVEVIQTVFESAQVILELARSTSARTLLLSTMEVYGEASGSLRESDFGKLDSMIPRNSYPEAKKLTECLSASYAKEYDVNVSIARLAQTFGEGVVESDRRVFAEFGRCAISGKDIALLTDGSSKGIYVSISDAVRAIICILLEGSRGEAYNIANEKTYCTILQMAQMVAKEIAHGRIGVTYVTDTNRAASFRKSSDLRLDSSKLRALGWEPKVQLKQMYERMLSTWETGGFPMSGGKA